MRKFLLLLFAALVVSSLASAATICTLTTAANECEVTVDGLAFSNFHVIAAGGNPAPVVELVETEVGDDGMVYLLFNPNISAPPTGLPQDIQLLFMVSGVVDQVDFAVGGRNATIGERICDSPFDSLNICMGVQLANIVAFSAPPGPSVAHSPVFAATEDIWVFKDIGVWPNEPNEGGGYLTSFAQSFHEIPEPTSWLLLGSGLLILPLLRKKMRKA